MMIPLLLLSIAAGGICHLTFFIRKEHHLQAGLLLRVYASIGCIIWLSDMYLNGAKAGHAAVTSFTVLISYCTGLLASMFTYRLIFHPLKGFPGPLGARISKLWHVWKVLDGKQYLLLDRLRLEYGNFVRTGPNEICVFVPEAVRPIHGYKSNCTKSAWYDMLKPFTAMNTTRNKSEHDRRRRAYEAALSSKAVRGYEDRVTRAACELADAFSRFAETPINISVWFQYFAFDMMGEFGFGKSFDQVKNAKSHFETDFLREGMSLLALVTPVPWLYHLGLSLPGLPGPTKDWLALLNWSAQKAKTKIGEHSQQHDIMSSVISDWLAQNDSRRDMHMLGGDAIAVVIAGSQTVAAALIFIFYRLAKHPKWAGVLRKEIDQCDALNTTTLQSLTYLNAFIQETLRLHPPVPSAGLRNTPPEGIMVGEQYIPGDVTVLTPNYSLGRLESCFEKANEFLPERWCTAPHLVKDTSGFRPFGLGPYSCVGKNLALLEVRTVTAILLMKYEVSFAPHEDCSMIFDELQDVFTASPGRCDLIFRHLPKVEVTGKDS